MGKVENAVQWAENIARDDSHGYSQYHRWGNPDYDCSSLVISAYEQAGIPVNSYGGATYTGNMYNAFTACGFQDVSGQTLKRGDVLLRDGHTALYCGDGLQVEASCDEYGDIVGANPGDQTGHEIAINPYSGNWPIVLRYPETDPDEKEYTKMEFKTIKPGDRGKDVRTVQAMLRGRGFKNKDGKVIKIDGIYGVNGETQYAVESFQRKSNLAVDAIVGEQTWKKLMYR